MKNDRSTITSLVAVFILGIALLILTFTAPMLIKLFLSSFRNFGGDYLLLVITFYSVLPFAFAILYCLGALLFNVKNEKIFTKKNVSLLRALSILLFIATLIFIACGFFYMLFFVIAIAAAFLGLIVHVVKNCLEAAVVLKDENELTI